MPASRTTALIALAFAAATGWAEAKEPAAKSTQDAGKKAAAAKVGEAAPEFTLTDLEGNAHQLSDYAGKTVVLEWFNPDCPFVLKHHKHNKTMAKTYEKFGADGDVVWLAVNSGAPGKQGHGLERNQKAAKDYGVAYPVLLDESGDVGRLYGAKTTPHMYVIDSEGTLLYRGAIDNEPSPKKLGDTNFVADCLAKIAGGDGMEPTENKSYGCSVKYATPEKKAAS